MPASNPRASRSPDPAEHELVITHDFDAADESIHEPVVTVMFVERGLKTDKYGWLSAFDELAELLGRLS